MEFHPTSEPVSPTGTGSSVGPSLESTPPGSPLKPPIDITIPAKTESIPAPTVGQKLYFHAALLGRKIKVWFANLLRADPKGRAGVKNTWFNQVEVPGCKKRVYLGMIPDDAPRRRIPAAAQYVSIVEPFEANYMDSRIHSDFKTIVHSKDNQGMSLQEIDTGVEALKSAIDSKGTQPIYLHCKSGVGRSATVLAAYLMKYGGMSFKDAIDRVQRDRPDAQLRGSNGVDTKHTKALRAYEEIIHPEEPGKRIEEKIKETVEKTAVFLGTGTLSVKERELLAQIIRQDPELYTELSRILENVGTETPINTSLAEVGFRLGQLMGEDNPIGKLAQKIVNPLVDRALMNTQFHTDGFRDAPFSEAPATGTLIRYRDNQKTFSDLLQDPVAGETAERLKQDKFIKGVHDFLKTRSFLEAQEFLKRELEIQDEQPYWYIRPEPGMISKHAGWIQESVPEEGKNGALKLTRTLGLLDGDRVRVGSVGLNIEGLTRAEAEQVMLALERKAQEPSEEFGPTLPAELKARVQETCEKFLKDCDVKIDQMHGELVGFMGTPENIAQKMRNVTLPP